MQNTSLDNFSTDLIREVFFKNPDDEVNLVTSLVSKSLQERIFNIYLTNLGLQKTNHVSSYQVVMQFLREFCRYYTRKIPDHFKIAKEISCFAARKIIERELLDSPELNPTYEFLGTFKISIFATIWDKFLEEKCQKIQYETSANYFYSNYDDVNNNLIKKLSTYSYFDPNKEIYFLLMAGFIPYDLKNVFAQNWCSSETVDLLIKKNIPINPETMLTILSIKKWNAFVPRLFANIPVTFDNLLQLMNHADVPVMEALLESHFIGKISFSSDKTYDYFSNEKFIELAKKRNYTSKFILQTCLKIDLTNLFQGYFKNQIAEIILSQNSVNDVLLDVEKFAGIKSVEDFFKMALSQSCNEEIILQLLKRCNADCSFSLDQNLFPTYSKKFILFLLNRASGVDFLNISDALQKKYDEEVILELLRFGSPNCELLSPALVSGYSTDFISTLAKRCPNNFTILSLETALKSKLSTEEISNIFGKCFHKIKSFHVDAAIEANRPENFIVHMLTNLDNVNAKCVLNSLKRKYSNDFVKKLANMCNENFNEWDLIKIHENICSEEVFLIILSKFINERGVSIPLHKFIIHYSTETTMLLINKIDITYHQLNSVLYIQCDTAITTAIVDKIACIKIDQIKKARTLGFPNDLIEKMETKCTDKGCSIF